MFEKLAKTTVKKSTTTEAKGLDKSLPFLTALFGAGMRVSYGDLTAVALHFGDTKPSGMSPAQRGAQLVGRLPGPFQPLVCRKNGTYHKNAVAKWEKDGIEIPADLKDRPQLASIQAGIAAWEAETSGE